MALANSKVYKAEVWDVMQFMFGKFNDHQLHSEIHFDAHIDEALLKKAVDKSAEVFPIISCKFVEDSFIKFPHWEDCGFNSEQMVKVIHTENIEDEIKKLIVFKTEEFQGPQLMVNIIRSSKRDSLWIVMNHMISDAAGLREYLYMLSSIYSNLKSGRDYTPGSKIKSRSAGQVFSKFSFSDKFKILFSSAKLSKYRGKLVFPLQGDNSNPFIVKHKIPRERFLYVKSYAKENNATVNDAILAAYIRALSKELNGSSVALPCPVDLRRYLPEKKAKGICNLTSNMICDIGSDIGQNYIDTLQKVKQSMDDEKDSFSCLNGPYMLEILFGIFPYSIAKKILAKVFNNPTIAMTNIGIIDKNKLVFKGVNIVDTYICGSIKYKPYFQVAVTTFDNEVTLSINFHGTLEDKKKINDFLCAFDEELPKKKIN